MGLIGSIGLILHPRRNPGPVIESVVQWARKNDAEVLGLPDEVGRIDCSAVAVPDQDLVARADLIVSLGGDGTMLRSMRLLSGSATPVLGVNLGRLGFLAEIDVDELQSALDRIDSGQFTTEARMAVRTRLPDGREVRAFNDIALVRVPGSGMAAIAIRLQDEEFIRYAADAVVVSTSTGSTAYSFAAGGPILSPRVEAILVVPASAHSSFDRALALPADEDVTLELLPTTGRLAVEVDGEVLGYLDAGDRVTVSACPAAAHVVRLGGTTFYQRARRKLGIKGSIEAGGRTSRDSADPSTGR
ncbi:MULTISPECIES: NAD(+)/NADH kinase [Streptomyces]|jgi:NAD+ kinase|uniref:NAD kinase n=1 Tax=Streptomyces mirabilis TaxID=68239 RepID=A0ABU3UZG7_9ACTN|nr:MULTISPECIES: NAD(+)/NADH kinase [Streptomyces]KAF5992331.1 ATP-NAD kinase [Streptomyces sp. WAC00263]MCX4428129.1 NAD(+)/NADH kinase [Streptomyces mirabilis]MCZ1004632.1 NAD(+)/NADH kinase [Streptomyces mirabilis]MDU8999314.1 NAD(+)/NADH kinase [Streptomyces mirabilis]QDN76385.1 NAD(+)/NADH kinase [Streptomyces sp. S1A1-7]